MRLSRKAFAGAAATAYATLGVLRFPAGAAEFTWKLATDNQPTHHMTLRLVEAVGKIKNDTNGRLDIQVFPNNALGSSTAQVVQVRQGAVEMCTSTDFVLADTVPLAGISATPFVFANVKEAFAAMAGPLGKYRRDVIAKQNVHVFDQSWNSGFRQIINNQHPINTPDDMKGLKLRIPVSPILTALFKAFGASPTPINSNEMYVALQTHLVDGIELPLGAIESYKIYEVQKYVSYTNHIWTGYTLLASNAAWTELPQNLRGVVEKYIDQAGLLDSADVGKLETTLEGTLKGQGMSFNQADTSAFRALVRKAGLYAQWKETYGNDAWALLEKSVGKLS